MPGCQECGAGEGALVLHLLPSSSGRSLVKDDGLTRWVPERETTARVFLVPIFQERSHKKGETQL